MKQIKFFTSLLVIAFFANPLFANNFPTPADIVKTYFTAVDAGNAEATAQTLSDKLQANAPFSPQPINKEGWAGVMQGFKAAFPDMKHELLDCIESGSKVAVRGVFSGQNNGPMMGNPATGNRVNLPFNAVFELDKSWKIISLYTQFDQKALEAQLMAGLPDPAAAAEATVRAMLAAADEGNGENFISYWAPDAANYFAGHQNNNAEMQKRIVAFKTGFPDIKRNLEEVIVSGNNVFVRGTVSGTNSGTFRGQPASGNKVNVAWLGQYKLDSSGKLTNGWVEFDTATLDKQLKGGDSAKSK